MSAAAADPTPRALLARYFQAMLDKNADAFADIYAIDAVHEFPLLSPFFPQRLNGREEIRQRYAAVWGASPIRIIEMREVAIHDTQLPSTIVVEAEYTATAQPSGKTFSLSFLVVMRVEGGFIVHLRDYMDALGAAFALDRLPNLVDALKRKTN